MSRDYAAKLLHEGVADLHMHTTASDGTVTVPERIELAKDRGLTAIAITDHDSLSPELTGPVSEHGSVEVITGVEVRADLFETKIEILGYFVDPMDEQLQELLTQARAFRSRRNTELVDRLAEVTGLDLSYDAVAASVDGALGRPHLAAILVEEGFVDSIQEAFDEYLAKDGDVYVPMERLGAKAVIEAIQNAGGVTSLAHPGRIRADSETVERMIERLVESGLDGIETWYPYGTVASADDLPVGPERALELANEYELIPTGGSDCHGPGSEKFRIGEVRIPEGVLADLRASHHERIAKLGK